MSSYNSIDDTYLIRDSVKDFITKEIKPNYIYWDDNQEFPLDLFKKMGEMGYMGMFVPNEYGGSGMDYYEYLSVIDEISQIDPSVGLSFAAHNSLCINHILKFGSEEQKHKWIPGLCNGKYLGGWALTEYNIGSDAYNMNTYASKQGDKWILNGSKNFITHALSADIFVIMARTAENNKNSITSFILEKGMKGFIQGNKQNKLGMRASETGELLFENVILDESNIIGNIGEGFKQAMTILDTGRISIAALSLGISKGAFNIANNYASCRMQFGQVINKFQAISFKLVDMATMIEVSKLLIDKAISKKYKNENITKIGAMAKLYSSESCVKISNDAVQILGGYGYIKDFLVEKFYRDAKLCTIGEGTSEIQKIVISKEILNF